MKYFFNSSLLVALALLLSGTSSYASPSEEDKCISCHDIYDKNMQDFYIHKPFLEKQCVFCHLEGNSSQDNDQENSQQPKRSKIIWLKKHHEPARTHFFLIPSTRVDDTLFIQIIGNNGRPKTTSISLPPLQQLQQLPDDGKPPEISDIQFHGVKRSILYTATISWKTDEPSDAQVHYGIGTFDHKTRLFPHLKNHHTVDISPVKPNKTYNYTVISKDMHGNRLISQPFSFSTKTTELSSPPGETVPDQQSSAREKISHQFAAVGDNYFISITANRSTSMLVGSHRDLRKQITIVSKNGEQSTSVKHAPMKNSYEINIVSCLNCHKDYQSETSHPINVKPRRGMVFPDDYPVLDDGKMHCMTCHASHASNTEARIRRPTKQELCVGCHTSYG